MKWPVGSSRGKHRAAHTSVSELETSAYDSGQHLGQQELHGRLSTVNTGWVLNSLTGKLLNLLTQ